MPKSFRELNAIRLAQEELEKKKKTPSSGEDAKNSSYYQLLNKFLAESAIRENTSQAGADAARALFAGATTKGQPANMLGTISGNQMIAPPEGKLLSSADAKVLKGAVKDKYAIMGGLGKTGMYDNEKYAYGGYQWALTDDYLGTTLADLEKRLAASQAKDAEQEKAFRSGFGGANFDDYQTGMQLDPTQWRAILEADHQLSGRTDPFDFDAEYLKYSDMPDQEYFANVDRLVNQYKNSGLAKTYDKDYQSETGALQYRHNLLAKEQEAREKAAPYVEMARGLANFNEMSQYQEMPHYNDDGFFGLGASNNFLYNQMNTGAVANDDTNRMIADMGWDFLLPEELSVYNALYRSGKTKEAAGYLEAMSATLNQRRATYNEILTANQATANLGMGALSFAGARGANLLNSVMTPFQMLDAKFGNADPNSQLYDFARYAGTVGEAQLPIVSDAVNLKWGDYDVGGMLYNALSSGTDSMVALGVGVALAPYTGGGSAAGTISMLIQGSNAASNTLMTDLERGWSADGAILHAFAAAAIESATERYSIDNLLADPKNLALHIGKAMLTEASEETVAYLVEPLADYMVAEMSGNYSSWRMQAEQMAAMEGISVDEAMKAIVSDWVAGIGPNAITAALSGAGSSTITGAAKNAGLNKAGREVEDVQGLVNIGLSLQGNTEAWSLAKDVDARLKGGKKLKYSDVGRLANALRNEVGSGNAQVIDAVADEAIAKEMVKRGDDPEVAKKNAVVVRKLAYGMKVTEEEAAAVQWTDNASDLVKELSGKPQETAPTAAEEAAEKAAEVGAGVTKTKKTGDVRHITFDDGTGEADGTFERFEADGTGLKALVNTADGVKKIRPEELKGAEDKGFATIMAYAEERGAAMPVEEANLMATTYATVGGNASAYLKDFEKVYAAGYGGKVMPETALGSEAGRAIFDQAAKQAAADDAKRMKEIARTSEGQVTFLGKANQRGDVKGLGSAEALAERMKTMTGSQRDTLKAVEAVAKATGVNVILFESTAEGLQNGVQEGQYVPGTNNVYIDLNAGSTAQTLENDRQKGTLGYGMLSVLSHEVTHYIERASGEGYTQLKDTIKDVMERAGASWDQEVAKMLMEYGDQGVRLTRAAAEAEVVAEGMSQILKNSRLLQQQAKANPTLFERIGQKLHEILNKIRSAFRQQNPNATARALMDDMGDYVESIVDAWDNAMNEVLGRSNQPMQAMVEDAGETVQQTIDQPEVQEALQDIVEAQEMVMAEAETVEAEETMPEPEEDIQGDTFGAWQEKPAAETAEQKTTMQKLLGRTAIYRGPNAIASSWARVAEKSYEALVQDFGAAKEATALDVLHKAMSTGSVYNHTQISKLFKQSGVHLTRDQAVKAAAVVNNLKAFENFLNQDYQGVQFKLRNPVEARNDGLMAVHNIKGPELISTLKLGGFPMPSIAIIKAAEGHTMYGEYSVIFGKETIDPQASADNKVYGADAWTPVFPRVETEVLGDVMYDVQQDMVKAAGQVDDEYAQRARGFFGNFGGMDSTTQSMDDIADNAWYNPGMLAAYMTDHGREVKMLTKEVDAQRPYKVNRADVYDGVLDIISADDYHNMPVNEMLDKYGDELSSVSGQLARLNSHWKTGDRRAGVAMLNVIEEAFAYEDAGRDVSEKKVTVKDTAATREAMEQNIDREDFKAWVKEKMAPTMGTSGIYNGKDRFTPSGNRRTFRQTHMDVTAENVVKSMRTQEESNIPVTDAKGLMAAASRMYKSIAEIKGDASRLGKVSEQKYNAMIAKADLLRVDLMNKIEARGYDQQEQLGDLLVAAAKKRMTATQIRALLKSNGFTMANAEAGKMAKQLIDMVQSIPTGYFEAKPRRVVNFDEIRMVVAPQDMPAELKAAMDERGIPYSTYDGTDADRIAKMNGVEDVQFRLRSDGKYDIKTPFAEQVRDLLDGKVKSDDMLLVGRTPKVLRDIGLSDLPIMMDQNHARKLREGTTSTTNDDHILSWSTIEKLPDLLADPVAVILSPDPKYRGKTVNVIVEGKNKNNKNVFAAIELDVAGRIDGFSIDINKASTVFGSNKVNVMFNSAVLNSSLGNNEVLYLNNKKALPLYRSSSELKAGARLGEGLINTIADVDDVVKNIGKKQTDSVQFRRWFADSKVVNADGTPKVMYHGSRASFTVFDKDMLEDRLGFFFTESPEEATGYGTAKAYYLSIKKPFDLWGDVPLSEYGKTSEEKAKNLKAAGYDGIVSFSHGTEWYIAFDPTQIKSATDNVGTFSVDEPDVQYSLPRRAPDVSLREYMMNLTETQGMTEVEKDLLKRYKAHGEKLAEAERGIAEQEAIIANEESDQDAVTRAKNRLAIYRAQSTREIRALEQAEGSNGFARLMRDSHQIVQNYLRNDSLNAIADASDRLEGELREVTQQLNAIGNELERSKDGAASAVARGLFDQAALNTAAANVKNSFRVGSMATKEIADRLALAYSEMYASNSSAEGMQRFVNDIRTLAEDVLRKSGYRYKSEKLDLLRSEVGTIRLGEGELTELKKAGISLSQFKKAVSPYLTVAENGDDLSALASNATPAITATLGIDESMTPGDLVMHVYDLIQQEKVAQLEGALEGMTQEESVQYIMAELMGTNIPLADGTNGKAYEILKGELLRNAEGNAKLQLKVESTLRKAQEANREAGRMWSKAAKIQADARAAVEYYRALDEKYRLMELKAEKQRLTEQLKSEAAEKLMNVKSEYRAREENARAYRKVRENVEKLRRGIGRQVRYLNTRRARETDKQHIPQDLTMMIDYIMAEFTDEKLANLSFAKGQAEKLNRLYNKLKKIDSDATYYWDDEVEEKLQYIADLADSYQDLKFDADGKRRPPSLEGYEQEQEILTELEDVIANVRNMVDAENEIFLEGREETLREYGTKTAKELVDHKNARMVKGPIGDSIRALDELVRDGNTTPVYFFERMQNEGLKGAFDAIRDGQRKHGRILNEARLHVEELMKRHHYDRWVGDGLLTFKTVQGHDITLTREQALWAYATAKREKSMELKQTEHLSEGGFHYRSHKDYMGKAEYVNEAHQLKEADLDKIDKWLTAEQKAYADDMVNFLSTTMGEYGNQASMDMYGYKKFREKYYFPFRTWKAQVQQRGDEGASGTENNRIKTAGFTRGLTHKANIALEMGNFTDVVGEHIQAMTTYATMVTPVENLKRLLNYKIGTDDGGQNTVRGLVEQKYGEATGKYIAQLLQDLNGVVQVDNRAMEAVDQLVRTFKRGAVSGSMSVVVQQPTALFRAMGMIDPIHFKASAATKNDEKLWQEMLKHSGAAVVKDAGKFDVGLGRSGADWVTGQDTMNPFKAFAELKKQSKTKAGKEALDAFKEWFTFLPGKADQITWMAMWKAVKNEQHAKHPKMDTRSEEFLDLCGKRFDDVMDHTQVYDSVLVKSNLMRSKNQLHKMATSFMAEPTLSLNIIMDALNPKSKHTMKQRVRMIAANTFSQVMAGALAAAFQAWNNDDDERNWAEKYLDRALYNISGNLNVLEMVPYISNVFDLVDGYTVQRSDMEVVEDLIKYTKQFSEGKLTGWNAWERLGGTVANIFGLPLGNVMREFRRLDNAIRTDWKSAPDRENLGFIAQENLQPGWSEKNTAYYERILTAQLNGDATYADELKEYMLTSKMVTENSYVNGMKNAAKERYKDGGFPSKEEAVNFLVDNGLSKDRASAFKTVDGWEEGGEDHSEYDTLANAAADKNQADIKAAYDELVYYGNKPENVQQRLIETLNEMYYKGSVTQAEYRRTAAAYGKDDWDENEWYWHFDEMDYAKQNGGSKEGYKKYAAFESAVKTGKDLKAQVQRYMAHGVSKDTLASQITSLFKDEYIRLYQTDRRAAADLQVRLLTAYQALGYDRNKKLKDIQNWLK